MHIYDLIYIHIYTYIYTYICIYTYIYFSQWKLREHKVLHFAKKAARILKFCIKHTFINISPIRILLYPQNIICHYHFSSILAYFGKFCSKFENAAIDQIVFNGFWPNFWGKWVMCSRFSIHKFTILALPKIAPQKFFTNIQLSSKF